MCDVTKKSPHPYYLKIGPCIDPAGRYRWQIFDSDGVADASSRTFATEQEADDNGRQEMQSLIEIWNRK
jgi:hypothetical protein